MYVVWISHGTARPTRMSKTFEPKQLAIAMSPCPCLETNSEAYASGIEVPAARNVMPRNGPKKIVRLRKNLSHLIFAIAEIKDGVSYVAYTLFLLFPANKH